MKRSIRKFALLTAIALGFFASCIEDVVDANPPVITVNSPTSDTISVVVGESTDFTLELTSGNDLVSFQALCSDANVELSNSNKTFTGTNVETVTVTASLSSTIAAGTVIEISFVLADAYKQTSKKKYILATGNLSAAKNFEWKRVGGNTATGLEDFGLTWTSNTTTNAVIKKGASKFVELLPAQWNSINTMQALKTAIDAATDMNQWEKVSATDASKTYDLTLGTIKGGKYYLIHVTNSTVTVATEGSTITIKGQYKE
jgi:hypothetical protein